MAGVSSPGIGSSAPGNTGPAAARVGIVGISIESNAAAPVSTLDDFNKTLLIDGAIPLQALVGADTDFGQLPSDMALETVYIAHATSGGPVDHGDFLAIQAKMLANLQAQGPFDGILVIGHGAGLTTQSDDLDGSYMAAVRAAVGPDVPISAFLDLHGNISPAMVTATDILVGMHQNPHTDTAARIGDAAKVLGRLMAGDRPYKAWRSVPLITPQVTQLTAPGEPFGDIMHMAKDLAAQTPGLVDYSLYPGFAFNDVPYFGFDVLAYGSDQAALDHFVDTCADALWADRDRFRRDLTTLEDAIAAYRAAPRPQIWADVADNPGGGARANTTFALAGLHKAGITGAAMGLHFDPALVTAAFQVGEGGAFTATFTADDPTPGSDPYQAPVTVHALRHTPVHTTHGMAAGQSDVVGRATALRVENGPMVVVTELRRQILSDAYFTHFGLDLRDFPLLVVKSRGHFRAGFAHLPHGALIKELTLPGLAPPDLTQFPFCRRKRPLYPLDPIKDWRGL